MQQAVNIVSNTLNMTRKGHSLSHEKEPIGHRRCHNKRQAQSTRFTMRLPKNNLQ